MEMKVTLGGDSSPPPPDADADRRTGTKQSALGAEGQPPDMEPREDALHDQRSRSRKQSCKR